MNDLSLLAIAFIILQAASRDHVIRTCYCYGSFSYVFKLTNLTRFILESVGELSENSTLNILIYFMSVLVKLANAECVKLKTYRQNRVVTQVSSNLTGGY